MGYKIEFTVHLYVYQWASVTMDVPTDLFGTMLSIGSFTEYFYLLVVSQIFTLDFYSCCNAHVLSFVLALTMDHRICTSELDQG